MAITTDCWARGGNSYLGITAAWLDPKTRTRKTCVLACTQMTKRHTYEYLAQLISTTLQRFELEESVVRCTTDNGSNFIKSFNIFGRKPQPVPISDDDDAADKEVSKMPRFYRVDEDVEDEFDQEINYREIGDILAAPPADGDDDRSPYDSDTSHTSDSGDAEQAHNFKLPPHTKCVAHLLNLVASADLEKEKEVCSPFLK